MINISRFQIKQKQAKIDKEQFEKLCLIQCTKEEICAVLDVSDKTLDEWCKNTYVNKFSEVYKQKREKGKASLRRKQWLLADKNPSMAIFLGKNMLEQKDKIETENTLKATIEDLTPLAEMLKEDKND